VTTGDVGREVARQLSQAIGQPKQHTAPGTVESITTGPPSVALVRMDGSSGSADAIPVSAPDPVAIGAHVLVTFDGRGGAVIGGNAPFGIPTGTGLPWIWVTDPENITVISGDVSFINAGWSMQQGSGPETGIHANGDGSLSITEPGLYLWHVHFDMLNISAGDGSFTGYVTCEDNVSAGTSLATHTAEGMYDITAGGQIEMTFQWLSISQPSDTVGLYFTNNAIPNVDILSIDLRLVRLALLGPFTFKD
jgi:hypothetical protein